MSDQKTYKTYYTDIKDGIYVARTLYAVKNPDRPIISFYNDDGSMICQSVTHFPEGSFQSLIRAMNQLMYAESYVEVPIEKVSPEEMAALFESK